MNNYQQPAPEGKDPMLWEIAQKRAKFKRHLVAYIIVNAFLWCIWFFTGNQHQSFRFDEWDTNHYPWPIWPMLGWGIGLAFSYADAYVFPKTNSVEDEYQKLKNQQKK